MTSSTLQHALVTGGTGFIGQHLVQRLIADGCRVSCMVRAGADVERLRAAGAQLVACDVTDRAGVTRAIAASRADVVYHLAGLVRAANAEAFMHVNEGGVDAVAAACGAMTTRPVLVLVSSLAASGPSREIPKVEVDSPSPVSAYGRSKLAGERAAAEYADGVPITIVRPSVVFGPGDRGVLEIFIPIARHGIHAVPGSGSQAVSIVAVHDLVDCLIRAGARGERLPSRRKSSESGECGAGVYFAAAEDVSYITLGRMIALALGTERLRILRLPAWLMRLIGVVGDVASMVRRRPGWVGRDKMSDILAGSWTCSSAKARAQLGWAPGAPIAAQLRDTAEWYRQAGWL